MTTPTPVPPTVTSRDVKQRELSRHIGKTPDEALVALSLSGGGIRSATFGLGVLQALTSLGLFKHLDYVSTVSGGGYIGGFLQAARAHGRSDALDLKGDEPREIRFLRAYSNYLTPRLGLFSGDTWAAVGNSLRNLILNFTILSLSLIAPLYFPWLAAAGFWQLTLWLDGAWLVGAAGALFVLVVAASTANMARPLRKGGWTKSGASHAGPVSMYLMVIVPGLLAMWLASTAMWAWASQGRFATGWGVFVYALTGGGVYGLVWLVGLVAGFCWRQVQSRAELEPHGSVSYQRAARAAAVLVVTAMIAGFLGIALMALGTDKMVSAFGSGPNTWLLALLSFPVGIVCLMLGASAHIGLAGSYMSDETREWWGRVGGVQLLIAGLLIMLGMLAFLGPHMFAVISLEWGWLGDYVGRPHRRGRVGRAVRPHQVGRGEPGARVRWEDCPSRVRLRLPPHPGDLHPRDSARRDSPRRYHYLQSLRRRDTPARALARPGPSVSPQAGRAR